ncbi:hypothetical protein SLA2020_196720 [Shorea laevis]
MEIQSGACLMLYKFSTKLTVRMHLCVQNVSLVFLQVYIAKANSDTPSVYSLYYHVIYGNDLKSYRNLEQNKCSYNVISWYCILPGAELAFSNLPSLQVMLMRRRSRYLIFTFWKKRITLVTQMQRPGDLNFDLHLALI